MKDNIAEMVSARLQMDEEDLLLEIGRQEVSVGILHSPASFRRKAQEILACLLPQIKQIICTRKEFREVPEFVLAIEIFAIVSQSVPVAVACTVAAYVAKRGFDFLCSEDKGDDE